MSGRKVFVSSDMSVDERLLLVGQRQSMASLLWPWLLTALDDWGRCEAAPLRLKARIWPMYDAVSVALIDEALALFAEVGLIERYEVSGHAYLRVPPARWWKWQTHIHRDKREDDRSRIPAPEGEVAHAVAHAVPRGIADSRAGSRNSARFRATARESAPSPTLSPTPSPSPTGSLDGQAGSGERANARAREADVAGEAVTEVATEMAADAALALVVTPTLLTAHAAPAAPHPAKVTPLRAGMARVPDPVWDACIAAMGQNGAAPSNRVERGKWAKGIQALKESLAADGSPPAEIGVRSARYRARYGPSVPLNPMALAGNWTVLAHDIPQQRQEEQRHGNFTQQQRSGAGSGAYGRSARLGDRRSGRPQVGSPEYYAQAIAEQYG